jgi:hypothetical protein
MENYTCILKHKKTIPYQIIAGLVIIFSIYWIQFFLFGGIILGLGSLIFILYNEGLEIDFKQSKYRDVIIFGNVAFGKWVNLPEINYISVFRTVLVSGVYSMAGNKATNREKVILINLIYGKNERILVYKTEDLQEAFTKAEYLSEKLNLKIYDATTKAGKWYEKPNTIL